MSLTEKKLEPKKLTGGYAIHTAKVGTGSIKKTVPSVGVVNHHIHGKPTKAATPALSSSKLIEVIQSGLPVKELDDLQASLGMPIEKLAPKLGISKATLHRRKAAGRLGPVESDRVLRFAR